MNETATTRREADGRWWFGCSCGHAGEFGWSQEFLAISEAFVHAEDVHGGAITIRGTE